MQIFNKILAYNHFISIIKPVLWPFHLYCTKPYISMRKLCGDVKIKEHEPKHDYTLHTWTSDILGWLNFIDTKTESITK